MQRLFAEFVERAFGLREGGFAGAEVFFALFELGFFFLLFLHLGEEAGFAFLEEFFAFAERLAGFAQGGFLAVEFFFQAVQRLGFAMGDDGAAVGLAGEAGFDERFAGAEEGFDLGEIAGAFGEAGFGVGDDAFAFREGLLEEAQVAVGVGGG